MSLFFIIKISVDLTIFRQKFRLLSLIISHKQKFSFFPLQFSTAKKSLIPPLQFSPKTSNTRLADTRKKKSAKSCNFYEKPRSRPYLKFFGKNTAPGLPEPLILVWRTRFSEQNCYFTLIYMLIRDRKNEENLYNATF